MGKWKGTLEAGFLEITVNVTFNRSPTGVSEGMAVGKRTSIRPGTNLSLKRISGRC